ncbi:MAG: helix-turn-helix domain-containing protein, partial [Fidelibacterota bacterium]
PLREHTSDISLFVERFGLEFCAKNDIVFRGFSADAIKVMRSYHWPGNIRELKNLVESLIVIHRGERITEDQVKKALGLNVKDLNMNLPILLDGDSDKMERELILKQLLYVRQDVNEIKQHLLSKQDILDENIYPSNSALYLPPSNKKVKPQIPSGEIQEVEEGRFKAIKSDAVGEVTITDLEHEMIERTLEKFNDNRRKTARALDISERTLYRKISEYGIRKN